MYLYSRKFELIDLSAISVLFLILRCVDLVFLLLFLGSVGSGCCGKREDIQ